MNKYITFALTIFIIGCANNKNLQVDNNKTNSKIEYNLDIEDDKYIKLKEQDASVKTLKSKAKELALAHIKNGEHILANFYIQEALSYDSNDNYLKMLLVKNQYQAALKNSTDLSYLQKAIKALKENINLITNSSDKLEADSMLNEVKQLLAKRYKEISNYYKRVNKDKASIMYENRAIDLGYVEPKVENSN